MSRRRFLKVTGQVGSAVAISPYLSLATNPKTSRPRGTRCINIVNFIRGVEPRFTTDLLLPVQKQMELITAHGLPATWLLQFDALASGPFVEFLKAHIKPNHEVGIWFEMNQMHCEAAGVQWRGRPGYEWDHLPPVAFTIGYTPEERVKLADAFVERFQKVWGFTPKSIASWNLDSITMQHLVDRYGVDAFAVCRDQIATDGFTIWGAPIAGYYPSKSNCWSPALEPHHQIQAPMLRMLGQDPVYYYRRGFKLPDGRRIYEPDTMEPAWTAGKSHHFIEAFLKMIAETPSMDFAYAQLGQENSFPWPDTAAGYPIQMDALAKLRDAGQIHVETMGETGRRFKKSFKTTPVQSQIMLSDPHANKDPEERTVWYQSRFYRANLHFRGDLPFLRDITIYSDQFDQPFLKQATRQNDVEQRMPAILDGYHWSYHPGAEGDPDACGLFRVNGQMLRLVGSPTVLESGKTLKVTLPVSGDRKLVLSFHEQEMGIDLDGAPLEIDFGWDATKTKFLAVEGRHAKYRTGEFNYGVEVLKGELSGKLDGWSVKSADGRIRIRLAQTNS